MSARHRNWRKPDDVYVPLREMSPIGEASRLKLDDESPRRG